MSPENLQVLRTIDKHDRIGTAGVVELLQKPVEEFGAGLMGWQAILIGDFLETKSPDFDDSKPLANISAWFGRASMVKSRILFMAELERRIVDPATGETAWDRLLAMEARADQTWNDGGRPANIAWALDDLLDVAGRIARKNEQEDAA